MTRARRTKGSPKVSPADEIVPPSPAPPGRRAVFIDVENTSSKAELMGALDGLALGEDGRRVEMTAIGNWRVVGQDLGRALAERGAQLVHSAPVSRVSDWSDLWIAVSAGIWLGTARPGEVLEVVSHDRAFDAVGDAAARLGVTFRRVTYRATASRATASAPARKRRPRAEKRTAPVKRTVARPTPTANASGEPVAASADQLRQAIGALMADGKSEGVSLDMLTRSLKAAGFQRPPGSTRLVTRLRRLKDVEVTRDGRVRLTGASAPAEAPAATADTSAGEATEPRRRRSSRRRGGRRRGRRGKGTAEGG